MSPLEIVNRYYEACRVEPVNPIELSLLRPSLACCRRARDRRFPYVPGVLARLRVRPRHIRLSATADPHVADALDGTVAGCTERKMLAELGAQLILGTSTGRQRRAAIGQQKTQGQTQDRDCVRVASGRDLARPRKAPHRAYAYAVCGAMRGESEETHWFNSTLRTHPNQACVGFRVGVRPIAQTPNRSRRSRGGVSARSIRLLVRAVGVVLPTRKRISRNAGLTSSRQRVLLSHESARQAVCAKGASRGCLSPRGPARSRARRRRPRRPAPEPRR
jgi:hypothetical protein